MDSSRQSAESATAPRPIAINALLTLFSRVVPFVIAVVAIPIAIRGLGVERFGILSLVWALLAQLTFFDFGFGRACTVLVAAAAGRREDRTCGRLVWTALHVQTVLGVLAAGVVFVAAPWLVELVDLRGSMAGEAAATFRIAGASLPFLIGMLGMRGGLEGVQRFDAVSVIEALTKSSLLMLPAAGAVAGWTLPTIALALVVTQVAGFAAYLLACRACLPGFRREWRFSRADVSSLTGFGKWIALTSLIGPLMTYADRWFIGSLLGVAAVTYYTTPFDLIFRVSVISESVIGALFPALSTFYAMKRRDSAARAAGVATKFVLLVVGLIGSAVILLSKDLLAIWLGADFARQSGTVLQLLTLGLIINSVARIPYATVQAVGRPDVTAKFHLAELPAYIGMLAFGIRLFGLAGAALAWTIRVALDGALLFAAERRLTGSARGGALDGVALGALIMGAAATAAAAVAALADTSAIRIGFAPLLLFAAALLAHRLVLDGNEREVLRALVNKGLAVVAR
jgi:O-antigen/teichoic acid export membrane protein